MMHFKRMLLLAGHYGSGKTNIAVNLALGLRARGQRVALADLDIVNPYFRASDSAAELRAAGVELLCSRYAGSNLDIPALPQEFYSLTEDTTRRAVLDIGGDDRGALALGRYAPAILAEGDYEMLLVVNRFRPLTPDAASAVAVCREIERAAGMAFTAVVNNSNLGPETTPDVVLRSLPYGEAVARATGLPLRFTAVREDLYPALQHRIENLLPLRLQKKID